MITFHNDHLVSPEFCKLIYDTVPERLHVPVMFVAHTKEYKTMGVCAWDHIRINLQGIYYSGSRRVAGSTDFGIWHQLLHTTYHEFGHIATANELPEHFYYAYRLYGHEYLVIETLANNWAADRIRELAEYDRRLCQPNRLGAYFDGRVIKGKEGARVYRRKYPEHVYWDWRALRDYRCYKSGGQYSIGEVAWETGAIKENSFRTRPDTELIRKIAGDLAYKYTDRAGRVLYFFAHGDIPEIKRRVAEYRAAHPYRINWEKDNAAADENVPF